MKDWIMNAWNEIRKYVVNVKSAFECGEYRAEMTESKTDFAISIDLPGMKREDIKVEIEGNEITLPESADMESIIAKYENGILSLLIHKKEENIRDKKSIVIE
ncbi:heat shock protein HSP20 [Blastocystis sp. subtype 4]|uniref:heat shock protein HSP20 n=1 Tax=Blastocystis sp. subtype 4 TaxID=944170 RepID=UPI000711BA7E|nr:heat shock protein HSP20 [Blastocystis sp. subtype 4]KNB43291.1 heat shock protein HSP20 [Blastocystis sp. subtype 4]|eukprot:XP_014526739.1 heat shock protein HSP20 [Blastocystis sp. subtype 4]